MICPKCKNDIMDGAKACPYCGESFLNYQPTRHLSIQQQAAEEELKKIDPLDLKIYFFLMLFGFFGMIYGIFSKSEHSLYIEIISIILFVLFAGEYIKLKETKTSMESILDNKKRVQICPNCKSTNIKQRFVKDSYVRGHSRTYKSKNINPFKPFTYTNYDTKPVKSSINYKTTYYCQNCGSVFDTPQLFEYK